MSWTVAPAAAKGVNFRYNGLQFSDLYFEPAPEVKEALRRLNLREPWLFDERKIRLTRAHNLAMKIEDLPKNQWTKWDEETFYLKKYLDEIENEKIQRTISTGLPIGFKHKNEDKH